MTNVLTETINRLSESDNLTVPSSGSIIKVSRKETPIIVATNKWELKNGKLYKQFDFNTISDRNLFIMETINFESKRGHNAKILVTEKSVSILLYTKTVNAITELDKEYQKFVDLLYKDVCYGG